MNLAPYILLTLELATAARTSAAFTAFEHDAAQKSRCLTFGVASNWIYSLNLSACLGETRG